MIVFIDCSLLIVYCAFHSDFDGDVPRQLGRRIQNHNLTGMRREQSVDDGRPMGFLARVFNA